MRTDSKRRMSGFADAGKAPETLRISASGLAESWAMQRATHEDGEGPPMAPDDMDPLGAPLSIRAVASLLGCSPWTVRQSHIPAGLPHFRSGPNGKITFFRDQVVAWILAMQQKGRKR